MTPARKRELIEMLDGQSLDVRVLAQVVRALIEEVGPSAHTEAVEKLTKGRDG